MKFALRILAAAAMFVAAPLAAAPTTIALVNGTGSDITAMEARKSGTSGWSALAYSARAGASGAASFDVEDCAWDLRVMFVGGQTLTFPNVNLCEARLVTLRQKDGVAWVDYD